MKIKITLEESRLLEKSIYEYQASLNILNFLLQQKNINKDEINKYIKQSEEFYIFSNEIKKEIIKKYIKYHENYNYYFNFDKCEIEYYEEE